MSHIVKCAVQLSNVPCLERAIDHLGLTSLGHKTHNLFGGATVTGLGFKLPNWSHPVVVDPVKGEASYDNYNEAWGKQIELDKLVQRYCVETTLEQAQMGGYQFVEETLENGDISIQMTQYATS